MAKPGPTPGSAGAKRIGETHSGSKPHDKEGGFAADPDRARIAGRKGGETVKSRLGLEHYKNIGKIGGSALKEKRGLEYYAEIGRKGGLAKGKIKASEGDEAAG